MKFGALLVILVMSTQPAAAQGSAALNGAVVASDSGRPVSDAEIRVEGGPGRAVSNAAGRFRLDGLAPGRVALIVRARGYVETRVTDVQVLPGSSTTVTLLVDPTPNFMDRVQVTGTKSDLSVGDLAAPADVIGRAAIEARGDQGLTDAIAHVPGAIVSTQLGLFESVMLRGMPRDSVEFTSTLLLVDGVPQTNANNAARVAALPINDAGSIEVVRGPNSALYGRTAIGGAVHLRTADPTPDHQAAIDLTAGQFETLKGVARVSGPVRHWGGYYVSLGKQRDGGYFKSLTDPAFSVGNTAAFAKLTFIPDRQSFGSVSVNRVVSDNSTPTNEPVIDGRLLHQIDPRFERFTSFNIPGTNYHQDETRFTINYSRQIGSWARLVEVFGYRDVQHQFIEDGDFIGAPFDLAAGTTTMYPFSQDLNEDNYYQELRAELTPPLANLKHTLTLGGSYERNTGSIESDFIYTDEDLFGWTISYLDPVIPPRAEWQHDTAGRTYSLGITGLFAQYIIEPTPRLILTAGGRYDRLAMENTRRGGALAEDTVQAFSPKLSATVRLMDGGSGAGATVNAYAAYSAAFLPPRRASSLIPADVPLNLQPEDIDNYEGGVKGSALAGRVSFEATYFWMKEDGVVLSTRQGQFFLPTNAGVQQYKGLETGGSVRLMPNATAYLNASFYRNRFGDFVIESASGDTVLTGNRLPISPDRVINWGLSLVPVPAVEAVVNVKHVGRVQTNRENTFELDGYSLVDAAVTWRRGPLRVTLSGKNLFDAEYYWNGDGETADPGRPRQVLVSTTILIK